MEIINLDMVPGKKSPVCHASQFDEGRAIRFNLYDSGLPFTLDGTESITFEVRKPDGNIVISTLTNTSDSYVDVVTTEQMTAVKGANLCEVRIEKGETNIGSLNVIMAVEMDPTDGGIESASEIDNLRSQVNEMVAEEVAEQYDSANVIFDTEPTEGHGTGYTVTSEGIKTAINNAFDYDNTASGSLVHITDGADNIPVKSLVSQIVAVESGNGQPKSPDNPYTISGFDRGVVSVCGKNLLSISNVDFTLKSVRYFTSNGNFYLNGTSTGETSSRDESFRTNLNFLLKAGTYYFSRGNLNIATYLYDYEDNTKPAIVTNSGSFTLTKDTRVYIGFHVYNQAFNNLKSEIMVSVGSSATTYEAYNGNTYTFTFGQTVYGGYFDNKGNLVVTHGIIDLGDLTWIATSTSTSGKYRMKALVTGLKPASSAVAIPNLCCSSYITVSGVDTYNLIKGITASHTEGALFVYDSNYDTSESASAFKTAMNGAMLVYELANPIVLPITSQDIPTLLGENNIFSNCGDVEVNYYTSKSNDILEFIDSEIGKKNGTNIPIEANSQDSIKDYVDDEVSTINTSLSNKANKTEDTTITVASGYTLISSCCGKTDRLVHLNFNVEKSGGFATGWQVIGTTEFKPNTLAYCPLWNVTNGVGNGEVRIDTDGTINFYVVTAGEVRLNANIGYVTS